MINWAAQKAGLVGVPLSRHQTVVEELYALFREVVFPDLKPKPNRTKLLSELVGTGVSEAIYIVHALQLSLESPGDVCEFGVAQGATSALIANELLDEAPTFWLFDSFKGMSKPSSKDYLIDDIFQLGSMGAYEGTMAYPIAKVLYRLAAIGFPKARTKIIPGYISADVEPSDFPENVCFAYVDLDFYEPIRAVLELLHPRLSRHAHVVIDDYGHFSAGAQTAVDEFLDGHTDIYGKMIPPDSAGHFCTLKKLS